MRPARSPFAPVMSRSPGLTLVVTWADTALSRSPPVFGPARGVVSCKTVEDWRWVSSRWPKDKRKDGVSHTVHRILASIADEEERWVSVEDAPFNSRACREQWTTDGAKRLVGHQVDHPVSVEDRITRKRPHASWSKKA